MCKLFTSELYTNINSISVAVVIGFDRTSYRVSEQQGSVDVAFQIISGILGFPVAFNFTTFSGSAIGNGDCFTIHCLVVNLGHLAVQLEYT